MDSLTHPDAIAKFLEEHGFQFEFYSKGGSNYLEIGGLRFDDGIGVLEKIYELVYRIRVGIPVPIVTTEPFVFDEASSSKLKDLTVFEEEIKYVHDIGLQIFVTDKPVFTKLGPFHYPRIRTPIHLNTLGWEGVIEYETAKSFIRSLYSGFSKIA